MQYFSTNRRSAPVAFREAVLTGQPDDRGLFFPSEIPRLSSEFFSELSDLSNDEIAFRVMRPYVAGDIPDDNLQEICRETVDFDFPLVPVDDRIFALELFHGPTLAFKDVGARFMSRCLRHFSRGYSRKTLVIVATSGDTGGAVASGFHNVEGIDVVILFPKGKVSRVQELQLTTFGGNVITLEIRGSFDECQAIAKRALADEDLRKKTFLTSANSINVARWLPQQTYYFFAMKQWSGPPPIFAVPSGNFGNIAAGMLAERSGLKTGGFIAACNSNDVVPRYLESGNYSPKPSIETLSNAMDVGDPSNFVRILEIFSGDLNAVKERLTAVSISDERTRATMESVFAEHGYVLDPHGAVGYAALRDRLAAEPDSAGIFLETAHPVKFDSVGEILGNNVVIPESVEALESKPRYCTEVGADYEEVRSIIQDLI
ncbi:MAG: threonine synthase [Pyrinomonadaceae bacterium]|nr:threonine synthase [Pyrinomonadaceae bacterium]